MLKPGRTASLILQVERRAALAGVRSGGSLLTEFDIIHRNVMHATSRSSSNCCTNAITRSQHSRNAPTRVGRSKQRSTAALNYKPARLDEFPADVSISSTQRRAPEFTICTFMYSWVQQFACLIAPLHSFRPWPKIRKNTSIREWTIATRDSRAS